jgi:Domain of unknown function (DUF6883)
MKLPNGDRAVVDIEKLRNYCLNPTHVKGKHKARVFRAALGLTREDAGRLREILLGVARTGEARQGKSDDFGQRFVIEFPMLGPRGDVTVRSSWIIMADEDVPRLINCYIP